MHWDCLTVFIHYHIILSGKNFHVKCISILYLYMYLYLFIAHDLQEFCFVSPPPQKKIIIIRKIRNNTNLEEICCLLLIFYTATCMFSYIVLLMWCSSFIIFIYSQHGDTVPNISIPQIWWFTKSQMWKTLYKTTQCKYYNTCMYSYNTGTCTDSS